MNNEKTVNSTIKDSTVKATPKKKKMKETSEIPLKHGKLLTAIMTIVTLVYVSPIFIVLMNSFKANTFVKTDTFAWPTGEALVGWANYIKGFTFGNYPFFKSVLYSFVITVLSTALILICTSMAAWYIARVDFDRSEGEICTQIDFRPVRRQDITGEFCILFGGGKFVHTFVAHRLACIVLFSVKDTGMFHRTGNSGLPVFKISTVTLLVSVRESQFQYTTEGTFLTYHAVISSEGYDFVTPPSRRYLYGKHVLGV